MAGFSRSPRAGRVLFVIIPSVTLAAMPLSAQERPAGSGRDFGLRGAGQTMPGQTANGQTTQPERRSADGTAGSATAAADKTINYGKPRAKHPLPSDPRGFRPKNKLPLLEPYKGSAQSRKDERKIPPIPPVYNPDAEPPRIPPPPSVAALPILPVKPRPRPDLDPFAPPGIGIGSLRLRPFVESSFGYDSNPNRVTKPQKGSALWRGDAGLAIQSDWAQHSISGSLRGGYSEFFSVPQANRPDGAGAIAGRLDVTRDTALIAGGTFALDTLRPNSPELLGLGTAASTNRPLVTTFGGYVGGTQRFNRLQLSLRGSVDRSMYGDANFSDGTKQFLSENNFTTVGVTPRISYEVSPSLRPFVEATVDRRVYDQTFDVNDYRRSSRGVLVRGGVGFDISRDILVGEVSGGYVQRNYDDERLAPLRGPVLDAALIWTATPLTTVTLRGTTNVNETTISGVSGALTRTISGEISHALMRNVTIIGRAAFQTNDYKGVDLTTSPSGTINERFFTAGVRAEYNLTRTVVVKASYNHERLKSTFSGSDYTTNVFLLGLRLQR